MDITSKLKEKILQIGVSEFGFARLDSVEGYNYPNLPYAISIAVKLSDEIVDNIQRGPSYTYFHLYRTINSYIDNACFQIGLELEKNGYRYMQIAASQSIPDNKIPYSGAFSHKIAARLAGLGTIGKNALFLSYKHGPRVRLGTVLTNAPLSVGKEGKVNICDSCNLCKNACPALAITGESFSPEKRRDEFIDAKACSDYMKNNFKHIGRGVVCGICMAVCPHGKK